MAAIFTWHQRSHESTTEPRPVRQVFWVKDYCPTHILL